MAKLFLNTLNPKEAIANSKLLSQHANDFAKSLNEMSTTTEDPAFKGNEFRISFCEDIYICVRTKKKKIELEKLQNNARFIKDASLQIKILSAVSTGSGAKGADPVMQSAKGLQANLVRYYPISNNFFFFTKWIFFGDPPIFYVFYHHRVMNEVGSEQIRTRFKNSVERTAAMNKVVNAWKNQSKK